MAEFRQHQIEGGIWAINTVRKLGLAYLSWQERCGKSGAAIHCIELSKAKTCLIVTKKKAITGWNETLEMFPTAKSYTIINYESIHKIEKEFDFIILDEAHHAISGIGKPSKTWRAVRLKTKGKPILYLSATPYAEHLGLIFHQLKLSKWTPLPQRNFYDFFRKYGIPHMTRTPYGLKETYSKYQDDILLNILKTYFNFKTRKEVGIKHEPTVNVVKIKLTDTTKKFINEAIKNELIVLNSMEIPLDNPMKLRATHYQLEGGTLKVDDKTSINLKIGREKVDYIKNNYDVDNIAIMAHFIAERALLEKEFPNTTIYSSDAHAEGVDLSHIDKLLIYSMSFKTSKYTQRLARQANHNRKTPIVVDILVADNPGIGYEVYDTVAIKKLNFDKNSYERIWQ